MTPWANSLVVVAVISSLPLLAIAVVARSPGGVARQLGRLVPLAAGALVGAPLFHMLPESLGHGHALTWTLGWMGVGAFAFFLIDRLLHTRLGSVVAGVAAPGAIVSEPIPGRLRELVPLLVLGDALHNSVDGVLIAGAYLDEPTLGMVTGVAIALHELPRELGTVAALLAAGVTMRSAVALNLATALLAAVSAVMTLTLGAGLVTSSGPLLAVGAGTFLYLAGALVISEWRGIQSRADLATRGALFVIGLLLTTLGQHAH